MTSQWQLQPFPNPVQPHPRASMCWWSYRWYKDVQSTKVLTFIYCIHGTGQEFAPSVFARSTLARPCFCRTGTSSCHQSQLKPIKDIQRSKGCQLGQWVLFDKASVHAIEPLLEWQSIRKRCSWHLMCVCHCFFVILPVATCAKMRAKCFSMPGQGKRPERPLLGQALKTKTGLST